MSLTALPSISSLIADPRLAELPHALRVRAARLVVDEARAVVLAGGSLPEDMAGRAAERAALLRRGALRRVINATGIVIHTNLGRAPMAEEAVAAAADVARGYANLEMTLDDGRRGGRLSGMAEHAIALSGAEAALGVNNNAAAVMMALTALAHGREVLVSRGELVEIGGSFRVPDIVSAGGAKLVEVPVRHHPRTAGETSYGLARIPRVLLDLVTVKFLRDFYVNPIYFFGFFGFATIAVGFACAAGAMWMKWYYGTYMNDNPLVTIGAMCILLGFNAFFFGLIAEVLIRMNFEIQRRVPYKVREKLGELTFRGH